MQQLQPFEIIYSLHRSLKKSTLQHARLSFEGCLIRYAGRFCILFCLLFLVCPTPFPLSLFKTRKGKNQKASAPPPPTTTFLLLLLHACKQAEREGWWTCTGSMVNVATLCFTAAEENANLWSHCLSPTTLSHFCASQHWFPDFYRIWFIILLFSRAPMARCHLICPSLSLQSELWGQQSSGS